MAQSDIQQRLEQAFDPRQAAVLAEALAAGATPSADAAALRSVVRDLAEAQTRTEQRPAALTERLDALAAS